MGTGCSSHMQIFAGLLMLFVSVIPISRKNLNAAVLIT